MKKEELAELKGVGKILDMLWTNSHYCMGEKAADRIEQEMVYYFGKNWSTDMYKIIEDGNNPHEIKPIKPLKLKKNN